MNLKQCQIKRIYDCETYLNLCVSTKELQGDSEGPLWSSSQVATCSSVLLSVAHGGCFTLLFYCWKSSRKTVNANSYCLWFYPIGNRTRVYRFSNRCFIHSTTDQSGNIAPKGGRQRWVLWAGPSLWMICVIFYQNNSCCQRFHAILWKCFGLFLFKKWRKFFGSQRYH